MRHKAAVVLVIAMVIAVWWIAASFSLPAVVVVLALAAVAYSACRLHYWAEEHE